MRSVVVALFSLIFVMCMSLSAFAESFVQQTELLYHKPAKTYDGYTIFTPIHGNTAEKSDKIFMIDMYGNLVHYWTHPAGYGPLLYGVLLDNGNLLRGIAKGGQSSTSAPVYQEVDWDNNVEWSVTDPRTDHKAHHAFQKIFNKTLGDYTILHVSSRNITHEAAIQLGCDPAKKSDYTSFPDGIVEFDTDGNLVWEWNISDHLVQDVDPTKNNYGVVADTPNRMDPNFGSGRSGNWIHTNSFNYNPENGLLLVNNSVY